MKTFYEHQDDAHGGSLVMMLLLMVSVLATAASTGLMLTTWIFVPLYSFVLSRFPHFETPFSINLQPDEYHPIQLFLVRNFPWTYHFPWELFGLFWVAISLGALACILIATQSKMQKLKDAGGIGVAQSVGGVWISDPDHRCSAREKQILNVVSEVAISSRVPTPEVYVLYDEPAINAFAVGLTPADMVIGVTEGCIRELNREQLQGVIAHEFAHIANGDTATNVQLIGYLHGLMGIITSAQASIEQGINLMVKSIGRGGHGVTGLMIAIGGALLWPVGLTGLVFAALVKAAYCRQREFLADAVAVEYTRNPEGIANAMKRIMGTKAGSLVRSPRCLALSHVFFAKSCSGVAGLLDSHPALQARVARLDKEWDGAAQFEDEHEVGEFTGVFRGTFSIAQAARGAECGRIEDAAVGAPLPMFGRNVVADVNEHATHVHALITPELWALTQERTSAEALIFALWAVGTRSTIEDDASLYALGQSSGVAQKVAEALQPHLQHYGLAERLMLFDAAINVLRRECEESDLLDFCERAETLFAQENDSDLFRWAWRKTVEQLVHRERANARPKPKFRDVDEVLNDCEVLLSSLAYANESDSMEEYALRRAANILGHDLTLRDRKDCSLTALDSAIARLQLLAPKARRQVLLAGSTSVESDAALNEEEALLMRGICCGLGYPPATLLPGQPICLK